MPDSDLSKKQRIDGFSRDLGLILSQIAAGRGSVQKIENLPKAVLQPRREKSANSFKQRKRRKP